ncbi:MAG: hypothetical protein JNK24_01570 [Alphaproteobacteria bacterium]|nr:hypothetical protein [Alphaproteobacteria bacterium]
MANNRDHDMDDMNESYGDSNPSQDYNYDSADSSYDSQESYQDDYATTDTQYQDYQDFDDHTANQDDSEWDEGNFDSTEPLAPPENAKKKSLALIAAIAVVILGGGAFVFFKASRTSLPPTPTTEENTASNLSQSPAQPSGETAPATSSNPANMTPPQPQPVASSSEQAEGPLLPEPAMEENAGKDLPIPNEVKVASPETGAQPVIADAAKTDTAAKPLVPFQPTSDFPSVNDIKKPDEPKPVLNNAPALDKVPTQAVTAEPLKEMAPVLSENTPPTASQPTASQPITSNPVPAPVSSAATEELAQSKKTIETLKSELDAQKKAAQASQSQVDELKGQIASLQAGLARANEKKPAPSTAESTTAERTTSSASENKNPAATHVERVKKSTSSPSRPKTQISQSQERSTARVAGSNKWILKGAQSGQAILGSLGHDDLRTVTVGETVSGLGRITSIERTASGWVVQGTSGSVSQ